MEIVDLLVKICIYIFALLSCIYISLYIFWKIVESVKSIFNLTKILSKYQKLKKYEWIINDIDNHLVLDRHGNSVFYIKDDEEMKILKRAIKRCCKTIDLKEETKFKWEI